MTEEFNSKGYWASYNTPYDENIGKKLGYSFSYDEEGRAIDVKRMMDLWGKPSFEQV